MAVVVHQLLKYGAGCSELEWILFDCWTMKCLWPALVGQLTAGSSLEWWGEIAQPKRWKMKISSR